MQGIFNNMGRTGFGGHNLYVVAWSVLLLLVPTVYAAQLSVEPNAVKVPISLKTADYLALKNNHQVKAFAYSVSAAGEDVGIAKGNLLP